MDLPVFTPRETVSELDRFIIGQDRAKRAVAIALRNRWRRQRVSDELRDEIAPKNIIMIGPTGVGKTEIARRLARLGQAPFLKVEASKFTEVGYVGRDVESMIRDLTELSINMVKSEQAQRIEAMAIHNAEERILDQLLGKEKSPKSASKSYFAVGPDGAARTQPNLLSGNREELRQRLRQGELDEQLISIQTSSQGTPSFEIFSASGMEEMMFNIKDALGNIPGMGERKTKEKKLKISEALRILVAEESEKLVDMEAVVQTALSRVQQSGIIFLDEIDKIATSSSRGGGPDVSRGGVQRDLLPIVEGSSVNTKHGVVKTDHILFIAAGAFHETKVSDLIPELQGRFPIRVELDALGQEEFLRILKEPQNSLVKQYQALLATEQLTISFSEEALEEIACVAFEANTRLENIGARRLHTVMETLLEEISFRGPEMGGESIEISADLVKERLSKILEDEDLSRYIL